MPVLSPSVAGFISSSRVGHLGTADASGQPLVLPICFAWDGAALYSPIDRKPKSARPEELGRVRNIRENARVSVVIDHWDEDWTRLRYVLIQGAAELLTGGSDFTRGAELLLAKYPQYRRMGLDRERGLMLKIIPARVLHWEYAAAAGEGAR